MLGLLLAALVVYTVNQLHFPSDLGLPGLNVVNLMFAVALGLLLLRGRVQPLPPTRLGTPLRLYFLMLALGTGIAMSLRPADPMADFTYLKTLLFYPLYYFLFYYAIDNLATARRLIGVVLAVAVVAGLEAWWEARSYGIGGYVESHRAAGPFGVDFRSANRAGVFYAMFLPLLAACALFWKGRPAIRMLALGGFLILAGAVLVTYSRQSYLIALVGIALLLLRRGPGIALVAVLGFAVVMPWLPQGAFERVEETKQESTTGEESYDESTESRWEIWSGAMDMWAEHPAGIGLNRFKGKIGEYSRYAGKDAHNYYVLTLAEGGVQTLLVLLWLLLAMWRLGGWLAAHAFDPESTALAIGFKVAVLCMVLGNVYGSPFSEGAVMGGFWALAGTLERYMQLRWQAAAEQVAIAEWQVRSA